MRIPFLPPFTILHENLKRVSNIWKIHLKCLEMLSFEFRPRNKAQMSFTTNSSFICNIQGYNLAHICQRYCLELTKQRCLDKI